jgi:hypothetical protein
MGYVQHMGEMGNAFGVSVGEPEGKRVLWRYRHRWEHDIIQG